jgi:hypothetical protein
VISCDANSLVFSFDRLEEQEILQRLISAVHAWEARVIEIIEPALHDCSTSVDIFSLLHILKVQTSLYTAALGSLDNILYIAIPTLVLQM